MSYVNWCFTNIVIIELLVIIYSTLAFAYYDPKNFPCGPYGFICEGKSKLRLCENDNLLGPAFLCPPDTVCSDESSDVCVNVNTFVDTEERSIRCQRNERIVDPNVPGCKGYILCIPNKNHFQGIKFKCSGNTIFNGHTRTCTSPNKYKCPLPTASGSIQDLYEEGNRRISNHEFGYVNSNPAVQKVRPIDCKNYKLRVTQDSSPLRATYFCPPRRSGNGARTKCTVFSNQYCLVLERDDEDQFLLSSGTAYRRPRIDPSNKKN